MPDQNNTIQLIAMLAGMQTQKRELALREKQLNASIDQFAQTMGYEKGEAEHKRAVDLLKQIAEAGTKQRDALVALGQDQGFNDQEKQAFALMAANAPETLAGIRQNAANAGVNALSSADRAQFNRQAASGAMTGTDAGSNAVSTLTATLANGANPLVTPNMLGAFAQRAASNQTPLEAMIQDSIMRNPDMRNRMAAVTAGTGLTANQAAQADIGRGGVQAEFARINEEALYHQMEVSERFVTARSQGMSNLPGMADLIGKLEEARKGAVDPKASGTLRTQALKEYNRILALLGWSDIAVTDPNAGPAGVGARFNNALGPFTPQIPPVTQTPQAPMGPGGVQLPPMFNNPMSPFVQRPPQ